MSIAKSSYSLLRRSGQPALRARLWRCSKPRPDPPGCAAASGTQGATGPLISVEHHGDGTSQYTFGEPSTAPSDLQASPSDGHEADPLHKASTSQPSVSPKDSTGAPELQQPIASNPDTIHHQQVPTVDQCMGGPDSQEASHAAASGATGEGPLAGIPPPRRAYTMLTPGEMKDQLDSANRRSESARIHTNLSDASVADSPTTDSSQMDTSSVIEASQPVETASPRKSESTQVFQKMSELGKAFCTALEDGNLVAAVAVAHTLEEHGIGADWKVLAGPRFFRAASDAGDSSAILCFLHALPATAPNTFTFQHAITACRALRDVPATLSVLEIMYERGITPDVLHCSNALAVCKAGGQVEQAFSWFARMTAAGTVPDAHMLAALAAACSARIRELRAQHKRAHSCDVDVSVQGIRRQQFVLADRAVGLLNLLPQTGRMADTALWNSILECVAFSGQLTRALQLLDDMNEEGCHPDSRTFVALLTACTTEGEKAMAQKVFRAALRHRRGTLRVYTAALGICLISTDSTASHEENLALAREIHRDVVDSGMRQDEVYKNKLIATTGCSGDLEFALETLEELRSSSHIAVSADSADAMVRACIACGEPTQAFTLYKQFIADGVVPSVKCANQIMDSFAATGNMHAAVNVLEATVAAGVVPGSGTIAALIGGCQRTNSFELAFQVANAAVARGIPMDGVIGYLLLKTCYTSIRMLWARTHAQIAALRANSNNSEGTTSENLGSTSSTSKISFRAYSAATVPVGSTVAAAKAVVEEGSGTSESRQEWAGRMMHALTGRSSVVVCEEGGKSARDWRDRAHVVYRGLITNGVPVNARILERAIACMMLDVSRREKARTPQPQVAAPGLPPPPPPDPACIVIARLDGRFDPRAYKYIDDGASSGRLPSTAVALSGRAVDLRGLLPATAEAFVLQLFHTLFRHLRGERGGFGPSGPAATAGARASGSLALIVPPFRPALVNVPSTQRHALLGEHSEPVHAYSQSEDDMDESWSSPFQTSEQVSIASRIRRLQRQHAIDLSAITSSHPVSNSTSGTSRDDAPPSAGSDVRGELVGLAAASALRSLKVPHAVEEASGVLVCDAEDLSTWAHRRHIELLTRLQQRRRRNKKEVHAFASTSSDSEVEPDSHVPQRGMHATPSRRDMTGDLSRDSGSLTPGLSGRGAAVAGLNTHTSTLRAAALHAQHMMRPAPLPDSTTCLWDYRASGDTPPRKESHRKEGSTAPREESKESLTNMSERRDPAEFSE